MSNQAVPASVAQSDVYPTGEQEVAGPPLGPVRLIMKYFLRHSLPSANSRGAVVSFWQKNVHKYWFTVRGLCLSRKSVVR